MRARDAEFFEFTENVVVWGVSGDSLYAHRAFADRYDLPFPLLADTDHSVAREYSSRYDVWEGQRGITKRAVFLVGPDRRIKHAWRSDDAYVDPDLWPIKEALDAAIEGGLDPAADPPDYTLVEERRRVERLD